MIDFSDLPSFEASDEAIKSLVDYIANQVDKETRKSLINETELSRYEKDPVGFCQNILDETLTDDVVEMMESVRDNEVTVAISANATGKTHGAARVALWFYLCHQDCKVFTSAAPPLENLKNLLWGEIGSVLQRNPDLIVGQAKTSLDVRRGPNDFLTGVTIPSSGTQEEREAKFSGKHQKHMLFVFDEGDAIPDEVYKGTDSCMSGGHVRLLIMLNPRQSSGAVYRMIKNKEANIVHLSAFNHPNVITGEDVIPGAVTREITVSRVNRWTRPFRDGDVDSERSTYILPDFLVGCTAKRRDGTYFFPLESGKYKIINPCFSYMVLGQYPAQGTDQLISEEWISSARVRYDLYVGAKGDIPPEGATGVMGFDVAEMGDDSNVVLGRYGGYLTTPDIWSGVDPIVSGNRGTKWYKEHKRITRAYVDGTGVGAGVAPHMRMGEGVIVTSIKVASKPRTKTDIGEFKILRDELLWRVREWLRIDPGAMLPPDESLIEELLTPTYSTDTGFVEVMKTTDMKKVLGRSPDRLMALALTFAGTGGFFDDCDFRDFPK